MTTPADPLYNRAQIAMFRNVVAALLVIALIGRAEAQPSSAQAEVLFRQAKQLMSEKKFADACAAFNASYKLDPSISTLVNEADCREKNGQYATAWGLFVDVERQTRSLTDASSVKLRKLASERAGKLEPRLSKLTISVNEAAKLDGLTITRNGETIDSGAWNRTLPVDGGTYTLTAKAAGREEWSITITVGAMSDTKSLTVPTLADAKPSVEPSHTTSNDSETSTSPDLSDSSSTSSKKSMVAPVLLTIGAVGLLGGAVGFELAARSSYDESKLEPDDATQETLWESANRKRGAAIGLGAAGLACAGVAVWLFVRSGGRDEAAPVARGISVRPILAAEGAGLLLDARY